MADATKSLCASMSVGPLLRVIGAVDTVSFKHPGMVGGACAIRTLWRVNSKCVGKPGN